MKPLKERIDDLLVGRGLAQNRSKARAMILAGEVYAGGRRIDKAGHLVCESVNIEIRRSGTAYVSRGGVKLAHALTEFAIDVSGFVCVDIGASTGGFTDCLLANGAKKVYAIDVGYGQLDFRLRNDHRIVVIEKTNIRGFDTGRLKEKIDMVTIDVSFIGLEKVFPKVDEISPRYIIALVKPQFQVGRGKVGKGGVVRDEDLRLEAVEHVKDAAASLDWKLVGVTKSPLKGPKGNIEYLAFWEA